VSARDTDAKRVGIVLTKTDAANKSHKSPLESRCHFPKLLALSRLNLFKEVIHLLIKCSSVIRCLPVNKLSLI